jgi:hypothetical protein
VGSSNTRYWYLKNLQKKVHEMNNRFYLANKGSTRHKYQNTYIEFFAAVFENGPAAQSHISITIRDTTTSKIYSKSGKNLQVGLNASKSWLANYILGDDDGAFVAFWKKVFKAQDPDKSNIKFIETWFKSNHGTKDFKLEGK